ncbi:hypothetical protein [Burkholderia thailandensis]|uniref:hypothetical protein n=1 Tax=Burkholderia thailandensis TaxID=57975 RepID=UPI001E4D9443|nr:hypothetical protein [Burkholderia thailandensis]
MKKLNMFSLAEEAGDGARRRMRRPRSVPEPGGVRAAGSRAANPAFYQALALRRAAAAWRALRLW